MNNEVKKILIPFLPILALCSCSKQTSDPNTVIFKDKNIVMKDFEGLGVEWGAYEDRDKITNDAWERAKNIADRLNPATVRCMVNYDWFVRDFDNKGDTDKTNDTWTYNLSNKYMNSTIEVLQYCQLHDIKVAFGCWNVVGNLKEDEWGMMEDVTSDIRWAKITADVMEYLVKRQGLTCIKYFVNSNEPNYSGIKGASKNYNNTYEKWSTGVKNVRRALDNVGLNNIGIVGGDTTGLDGSLEYLGNISKDQELKNAVGDYGCHIYAPNYNIDLGQLTGIIKQIADPIKKNDPGFGVERRAHIWEAGLLDGKDNETDSNRYIFNYSYGIRMADYTIQCILGGISCINYWDFDDAMHFMYQSDGTTNTKGWGMFSSLSGDSAIKQELRPWFHSSVLLTNLLRPGSTIIDSGINNPEKDPNFRSLAVVGKDNKRAGFVAVNRGIEKVSKTFVIDSEITNNEKLYIYLFSETTLKLGEDGYVVPNYVIDGSLNNKTTIEIAPNSVLVVSNEVL